MFISKIMIWLTLNLFSYTFYTISFNWKKKKKEKDPFIR